MCGGLLLLCVGCGLPDPWVLRGYQRAADAEVETVLYEQEDVRMRVAVHPTLMEVEGEGDTLYVEGVGEFFAERGGGDAWEPSSEASPLGACIVGSKDTVAARTYSHPPKEPVQQGRFVSKQLFRFRIPASTVEPGDTAILRFAAVEVPDSVEGCPGFDLDSSRHQRYVVSRLPLERGRGAGAGLFSVGLLMALFGLLGA